MTKDLVLGGRDIEKEMDWKGNGLKRKRYSIPLSTNPVSFVTKEGTVEEVKRCNIILVEPLHHKGLKPPGHDLTKISWSVRL